MPADMHDYFKKKRSNSDHENKNSNDGKSNKQNRGVPETPDFIKNIGKKTGLIYVFLTVVALFVISKPYVIINSGEVGILQTLGKYDQDPLRPGFHLKMPFVQKVIILDTKLRQVNYNRNEILQDGRGINQRPSINILDSRGLPVEIQLTVQYRLKPLSAPQTIAELGLNWEDKAINPNARDVVRSVIGNYTAEELPVKRNDIAQAIESGMRDRINKITGQPIVLENIQLRGIILPPKIKDQIERVQIARQEAEKMKNEVVRAQQEAKKKAEEARGIAEAKRIEAQGIADKLSIESTAQAQANLEVAKSLTPRLLQLRQIEVQSKFNEALAVNKDTKVFLTPGGAVPNIWVDMKNPQKRSSAE